MCLFTNKLINVFFNSKLRYISNELFGDFSHYLWGTFEFYMAICIYMFALWMRIYVHYLAQYLYLRVRPPHTVCTAACACVFAVVNIYSLI